MSFDPFGVFSVGFDDEQEIGSASPRVTLGGREGSGSGDEIARVLSYVADHRARFVSDLRRFITFASVSGRKQYAEDVRGCASWLAQHLQEVGLEGVKLIETAGAPIVHAEWRHQPKRPTVLVYGHYDVQPADPLAQWRNPPFRPSVRGDNLYGRGASDDKGQLFVHVKALEAFLRSTGSLPANVVCLFEGEEESGSQGLGRYLARAGRGLGVDLAVVSDMPMRGPDRPAITYSMRGAIAFEIELTGPRHDLHSGLYGGAVPNPLQALCETIARLERPDGRIAVPGFYDRVRGWPASERRYMSIAGPSDAELLHAANAAQGRGEPGFTLYERVTIRPALTVNGITGGYQGSGGKAVIPAKASAKLSFRLVPDQDPKDIGLLVRGYLSGLVPRNVDCVIRTTMAACPVAMDRDHPALRAAGEAYHRAFGRPPVFLRSGGTIPVVHTLRAHLGIPTVLMGFALPDDRMHAPNERLHLPTFFRAIETSARFLALWSRRGAP